jgi:hypothetical protein
MSPDDLGALASRPRWDIPLLISVTEAGKWLGLRRSAAYNAVREGVIPVLRIGHRMHVPVPELLASVGLDVKSDSAGWIKRNDTIEQSEWGPGELTTGLKTCGGMDPRASRDVRGV